MSNTTGNMTWTHRTWQIARADLDLSHVFLPKNKITFKLDELDGIPGYRVAAIGETPTPECFRDTFLVAAGKHRPLFHSIEEDKPLPFFNDRVARRYIEVAEKIATYTEENREIQHLEGMIKILCHAKPAQLEKTDLQEHPPVSYETPIHVYQFADAVENERSLLVIRISASPLCPVNGNGTVLGYD